VRCYDADPTGSPSCSPASTGPVPAGAADRRRLGLPERGHVIAFVGRIQPLKGPDVLISALAALRRRNPPRT
jgi:D-inositol-3-phosphate glycosyltransferase